LLRIRTELPVAGAGKMPRGTIVTFKRPVVTTRPGEKRERHKVREEIEMEVSDAKALATILKGWG